jgi:hypothetical protein
MLRNDQEELTRAIHQLRSTSFTLQRLCGSFDGELADFCERWGDEVSLAATELREALDELLTSEAEADEDEDDDDEDDDDDL